MARYDYFLAHREVIALAFAALLCLGAGGRGEAASSGGTTIENSVTATYTDAGGHSYATRSNAVVATVATVAAIVISPKETKADAASETVPVGQPATRTFVVYNGSNIGDAYRVTAFAAGSQSVTSMKWILADGSSADASNGAVSPAVAPGQSISLTATISTAGMNVGVQVPVTATVQTTAAGTVNGLQSDAGQEWIVAGSAPALSGPDGANSKIAKTVNKSAVVQSQPGSTVTFDIVATNTGGSPAQQVVVTDTVPAGLTIVASSAKINGQPAGTAATVQGQTLTVTVGTLNAGAQLDVSFDSTVPPNQTLGQSFTNIAGISANGLPPQQTTPANVFAGSANIVFDGYGGGNHPITGAVVALLDQNGNPVNLSAQKALSARTTFAGNGTDNPVVTGADGTYGFALAPSQIATSGSTFYLTIDAPGYLNRRIQLDIAPGVQGELYDVKAYSRDGQPLAAAGGFTLTNSAVQLQNVFGLFGNLPLFQSDPIDVTKTADRQSAQPGDRIVYTVTFSNSSNLSLDGTTIVDTLPAGLVYAPGSAFLDGKTAFEPSVNGRTLTWNLASLPIGGSHTLTYATVVFPSVAAGTTLTNAVTVSGSGGHDKLTETGGANVSVVVDSGAFSDRRVVTGRVFVDALGTGHFTKGDSGVAGVRVYLEDGSYATTDANGLFSFASVRPGMHVLRIDTTTLPAGVHLFARAPMGSTRAPQRLLHGVLDVTTMEDVEFAVQGTVP